MRKLIWTNISIWSMLGAVLLLAAPGFASVFYDYKKIAATGENGITAIQPGVSVNAQGRVAFQATKDGRDNVFVSEGTAAVDLRNITANPTSARLFNGGVQINDNNQVISRDRIGTALGPEFRLRIWDSNLTTGAFISTLVTCGGSFGSCLTVLPNPSLSNGSSPLFAANIGFLSGGIYVCKDLLCPIGGAGPFGSGQFKAPLIATSGDFVIRNGDTATSPISVIKTGTTFDIAFSGLGWTALGAKPGISDDGSVVAFAGNRGSGEGVFTSIQWGPNYGDRTTVRVAGEGLTVGFPDLGADLVVGNARYFSQVSIDERIGVTRHVAEASDPTGLKETIVVSFLATPNLKSPTNSYISGLVFSDQLALWTRRIDVMDWNSSMPLLFNEVALTGSLKLVYHYPIPVAQVGEKILIGPEELLISGLVVHDPLSTDKIGRNDSVGNPMTKRPGDHFVVFMAQSGTSQVILRADHQSACILFVQRLAQGGNVADDPVDWQGERLDTHLRWLEPPVGTQGTIGKRGCVLTAFTMQMNYAAEHSGIRLLSNPGFMNDVLKGVPGAFSIGIDYDDPGADLKRDVAAEEYVKSQLKPMAPGDPKVAGIMFDETVKYSTSPAAQLYLKDMLCNSGLPIEIRVKGSDGTDYAHSVLVTGTVNDRFIIVDPGHRDRSSLSGPPYDGKYRTKGVITDPPNKSKVIVSIGSNADIDVSNDQGLHTNAGQAGIPLSVYDTDLGVDEESTAPQVPTIMRYVSIKQPQNAQYTIVIKGLRAGPFKLEVAIIEPDGTVQPRIIFDGTATAGSTQSLQLKVDTAIGGNSTLTSTPSISGDLDGDSDIDKNDIAVILAAKGTAASGPNDPRDIDKDGKITILDARKLSTMCTRLNCATQ